MSIRDFIYERTLSVNNDHKLVYILGTLKTEEPDSKNKVLLKIEKTTFEEKQLQLLDARKDDTTVIKSEEMYFENDIYHKFFLQINPPEFTKLQCDFIYPAP